MTAKRVSLILVAVLIFYIVIAGSQGVRLIQTGEPVAIIFGLAILVLPLIGLWVVWRELQFGMAVEKMAKVLEAEDGLPVDDLPRTDGGRVDRDAADEQFQVVQAEAKADPADWRAWFRVAASYDAAGDRRRARGAMYHAISLFSADRKPKSSASDA